MNSISDRIKELALKKDVSLSWIAKEIGATHGGFYKMIDSNSFKVDTLQKIANVLEVPIVEFFGGNEVKKEGTFETLAKVLLAGLGLWAALSNLETYIIDSRNDKTKTKEDVLNDIENKAKEMIKNLTEMNEDIKTNQ